MAKIEWVHHRLERWAMWMSKGGTTLGYKTPSTFRDYVPDEVTREAVVPVSDDEAWQTHRAIERLPEPLAETVARYYLEDSDRTQRAMCISRSVLSQRIDAGHHQLAALLARPATAEQPSYYRHADGASEGGFTR